MAVYQHSVTGAVVSVADDYQMESDWVPLDPTATEPVEEVAESEEAPVEEVAEPEEAPAEEPKQQPKNAAAKKTAAK